MVTGSIAWVSFPIPGMVAEVRRVDYASARMEQIIFIEIAAFIGVLFVVLNIVRRINQMHRMIEVDYLELVQASSETGGVSHTEEGEKPSV